MANPSINIATLPKEEAVRFARAAGSSIGTDALTLALVFLDLRSNWLERYCNQAAPGMSDDEFDAHLDAVCNAFDEGFEETYMEAPAPTTAMDAYSSGIQAAKATLHSWQSRGEGDVTPGQMAAEMLAGIYGRAGDERRGFADTLMAYVMLSLGGGVPTPCDWIVEHDLKL